jgi:radical SAM protein with 4Fe4S-binding SPASM domain
MERVPKYRDYYEQLDKIIEKYLNEDVIFLPPYIGDTVQALISTDDSLTTKNCGSFFSQVFLHPISGDIYPCLSQDTTQYRDIARLMNINNMEINWPVINTIRSFMMRRNRKCFKCKLQSSCFGGCYHSSVESNTKSAFNSYWNISNITKCIFSYNIYDVVLKTSQKIIDHINKTS